MTDEQITAIAEEYAHSVTDPYKKSPYISQSFVDDQCEELSEDTEAFLKWLYSRYCIIEKKRLIKEYNEAAEARYEAVTESDWRCAAACGSVIGTLEDLFGEEMFHQNEE